MAIIPHDETQRTLGHLEGRLSSVEALVTEVRDDLKGVVAAMNQAKGGWKAMLAVGTIAGAVGATIVKLVPFIGAFR